MKSSSRDKAEGTAKDIKGDLKKKAGQATDDEELENEGRAEKTEGKIQKKTGDVKKVFNQ